MTKVLSLVIRGNDTKCKTMLVIVNAKYADRGTNL